MTAFYQRNHTKLYQKDSRDMSELADESVQCVITSPPYWGPRQYSGEQTVIWGGDINHKHAWLEIWKPPSGGRNKPTNMPSIGGDRIQQAFPQVRGEGSYSYMCSCGAWRGEYGHEPTPQLYVAHSLEVLREVRRVLRSDGVVFWNIGDNYITGKGRCFNPGGGTKSWSSYLKNKDRFPTGAMAPNRMFTALPDKNLALIPERLAIALQDDGWIVRSRIIWRKTNCKPESVKDRPTTDYEFIFMITKNKRYYWDHKAALIPYVEPLNRWEGPKRKRDTERISEYDEMMKLGKTSALRLGMNSRPNPKGKNIRTIWAMPTARGNGAHFAVFPEELPTRCIKLATRPGDVVLDPFCGTGTTLCAANQLGRQAIGYEISESYCKLAVKKIEKRAKP